MVTACLTIKGRIVIAKSLVISQMIYIMSAIRIKKKQLQVIQTKIMKFLWRGRPPKVARNTLFQNTEMEGLSAPNVVAIYKAMRVSWVGKIIKNQAMAFARVFAEKVQLKVLDITQINYHSIWINSRPINEFYKEMLQWFNEARPTVEPLTGRDVRKQIIWLNKEICVDGTTVCYKTLYNHGIKHIDDFTDHIGRLLSYAGFMARFNVPIGFLQYISVISAIPTSWKRRLIGSEPLSMEEKRVFPHITIQEKKIPIHAVKVSFYLNAWIKVRKPHSQLKWEQENVRFDEWNKVYLLPFKMTTSTKLQSLQYRIVHRYFPTRRFLCIRGVVDDPFCNECGELDIIQHYFAECYVRIFWGALFERVNGKVNQRNRFHAATKNIIFGAPGKSLVVNFIILIAKQFIVNRRFKDERICWADFVDVLRRHFSMEKIVAAKKKVIDKFINKWSPFVTQDLHLAI